jgi:hypothetical protein
MLSSLLSESLAVTLDNLDMASSVLACVEEAAENLEPEIRQRLALVHIGLAMAMQGLQDQELHRQIALVD